MPLLKVTFGYKFEELAMWKSEVSVPAEVRQWISTAGVNLVFLRNSLTRVAGEKRAGWVWGV